MLVLIGIALIKLLVCVVGTLQCRDDVQFLFRDRLRGNLSICDRGGFPCLLFADIQMVPAAIVMPGNSSPGRECLTCKLPSGFLTRFNKLESGFQPEPSSVDPNVQAVRTDFENIEPIPNAVNCIFIDAFNQIADFERHAVALCCFSRSVSTAPIRTSLRASHA